MIRLYQKNIAITLAIFFSAAILWPGINYNTFAQENGSEIIKTVIQKSESHDAEGHELHQAVYLLHPANDTVYEGKVTFTASRNIDIFVYHDITESNVTEGLNIHRIDGRNYAATALLKNVSAGTVQFAGSGILAHVHFDSEDAVQNYNLAADIHASSNKRTE